MTEGLKKWRIENPEKVAAINKRWRDANKEKMKEYFKKYREDHKFEIKLQRIRRSQANDKK